MSNKSSMFMSSDSLNDTRIFSAPHKTVLIITPDGRLEAGEGLSNDEVSRELFKSCSTYFDARMDALERENAELRNKIAALDRKSTRLNSRHVSESRMPSSA